MRINKLYFVAVLAFVLTMWPDCLFAGLNVDPVVLEAVVDKGVPAEQCFKLKNTGKIPLQVRVELDKKGKRDIGVADWFSVETDKLKLDPGQEKKVPYKIVLPEGAEGEYRCMVFFVADELGKQKSLLGIRFGVPVYAIAQNTVKLGAAVNKIKLKYDPAAKKMSGTVFVKNESNIHIRPQIDLEVLDAQGERKCVFNVPFGQPAQVGQTRPFMFSRRLDLVPGSYQLKARVDYGKLYGAAERVAEGETEFEVKK